VASTVAVPTVVLGLPSTKSVAALVMRVQAIIDAMTANAKTFVTPIPSLAQVQKDLDALNAAETAFKNHLGPRATRDDAMKVVVVDAHGLRVYVQQVVNGSPSQAEVIVEAAAMTLKKTGARSKNDLAVKQSASGSVRVIARATKGAKAHDWQYSTDGGKTWLDAPSTTKSSTTITGLTPGATVNYRVRALLKTGATDWSQPVSAVVT
jgi:hypothetical protein